MCKTLVYRVEQTVGRDMENTEGPVLPNEEWAENEVLKSSSGWIELSKQCLVRMLSLFVRTWGMCFHFLILSPKYISLGVTLPPLSPVPVSHPCIRTKN